MYSFTRTRLCTQWTLEKNLIFFIWLINVLNLISLSIIDSLLLCHVSWVIEIESGHKKIGSSQRYEVQKLAQYQWDIRYFVRNSF